MLHSISTSDICTLICCALYCRNGIIIGRFMSKIYPCYSCSRWRHQMETLSASLAPCAGNSPVTGEFPAQRPVTRNFDVFFDLRLNKRLSKQPWGWWFETPSWWLWRHCDVVLLTLGPSYECPDVSVVFLNDTGKYDHNQVTAKTQKMCIFLGMRCIENSLPSVCNMLMSISGKCKIGFMKFNLFFLYKHDISMQLCVSSNFRQKR